MVYGIGSLRRLPQTAAALFASADPGAHLCFQRRDAVALGRHGKDQDPR
jgi:hypothetical protein